MNMAINSTMQSVQGTSEVQIAQQNTNMAIQDSRQRRTLGLMEIAKRDNETRPTIQICAEVSKTAYKSSGIGRSLRGGMRPGSGSTGSPAFSDIKVSSTADIQTLPLKDMTTHKTCDKSYGNVAGCGARTDPYAKGDILTLGIKTNMAGANTGMDQANYSLDENGYQVGIDYIKNATMHDAVKMPSAAQIEKNPAYLSIYKSISTKLNASGAALKEVLDLRMGGALSSFAQQLWSTESATYSILFPGLKPPTAPSFFEMVNLNVYKDYLMPTQETAELSVPKRLALSNYIAWKHYQSQETTNILLSHILVQLTTPVHKEQADVEYMKTSTLK
jgi:hypothetical protein